MNDVFDFDNNPFLAFERGILFKKNLNHTEAVKEFTLCINKDYELLESYSNRALCYLALKKYDLSIVDTTLALEYTKSPDKLGLLYELRSRSYLAKDDFINGLIDLNKSCELCPSSAFRTRAELHFKQKNYYEALMDFSQMCVFEPNKGIHFFNVGVCYYYLREKDKALEFLSKALNLGYKDAKNIIKKVKERL